MSYIQNLAFSLEAAFEAQCKENFNFPGYERQTTWVSDLVIAMAFGPSAVKQTINDSKKHWKNSKVFLAEMAASLNFLCWWSYDNNHKDWSKFFGNEYDNYISFIYSNCTTDIQTYVYRFLD